MAEYSFTFTAADTVDGFIPCIELVSYDDTAISIAKIEIETQSIIKAIPNLDNNASAFFSKVNLPAGVGKYFMKTADGDVEVSGVISELEYGTEYTFYQVVEDSEEFYASTGDAFTVKTRAYCDSNDDGICSVKDLIKVKKANAALSDDWTCDVDENGVVDAEDLTFIITELLG